VPVPCASPAKRRVVSTSRVSADPVDPTRVNVFERSARPEDLDAFRATPGDSNDAPVDFSRIRHFEIERYSVEHISDELRGSPQVER
jgi:hypothetical protein